MPQETAFLSKPVVYAQSTSPSDERDGILWVDTSASPRETNVYSAETGSWEPVAVTDLAAMDTKNHSDLDNVGPSQHHERPTITNQTSINGGWNDSIASVSDTYLTGGEGNVVTHDFGENPVFLDSVRGHVTRDDTGQIIIPWVRFHSPEGDVIEEWTGVITYSDGETTINLSETEAYKVTFGLRNESSSAGYGSANLDIHTLSLPTHSHGV